MCNAFFNTIILSFIMAFKERIEWRIILLLEQTELKLRIKESFLNDFLTFQKLMMR